MLDIVTIAVVSYSLNGANRKDAKNVKKSRNKIKDIIIKSLEVFFNEFSTGVFYHNEKTQHIYKNLLATNFIFEKYHISYFIRKQD